MSIPSSAPLSLQAELGITSQDSSQTTETVGPATISISTGSNSTVRASTTGSSSPSIRRYKLHQVFTQLNLLWALGIASITAQLFSGWILLSSKDNLREHVTASNEKSI